MNSGISCSQLALEEDTSICPHFTELETKVQGAEATGLLARVTPGITDKASFRSEGSLTPGLCYLLPLGTHPGLQPRPDQTPQLTGRPGAVPWRRRGA